MGIVVKNGNFGQQWELSSNPGIFGQKSKVWSKIEGLIKNRNFW